MPSGMGVKYSLVFLLPAFSLIAVLYAMSAWSIGVSFTDMVLGGRSAHFVGLAQYAELVTEDRFWSDLRNNVYWLAFFVLPTTFLGFVLAFVFEAVSERLEPYLRPLFLYPTALSFAVVGVLWSWIFDPHEGVLNMVLAQYLLRAPVLGQLLALLGITPHSLPMLLDDPNVATFCILVAAAWQYTGFSMLLFLAALRGSLIRQMMEAAMVDGASTFQIFRHIVVPNMRHAFLVVTCLLSVFSLKAFDLVWVMTRGGPGYATEVLAVYMYVAAFLQDLLAKGCALATIILVLTAAIIVPYVYYAIKRWFGR